MHLYNLMLQPATATSHAVVDNLYGERPLKKSSSPLARDWSY